MLIAFLLAAALTQGAPKNGPAQQTGKAAAAKPDSVIEEAIRTRLSKSKIGKNGFQVHVRNGIATLTGKTDVIQHKAVATRLAKLGGAIQVRNQIEVSEKARSKAAAHLADVRESPPRKHQEPTRALPAATPGSPGGEPKAGPTEQEIYDPAAQPPPPRPRRAMLKK